MNIGIIFAGGVGQRFENIDLPKQFVEVLGKPIIIHTLEIFENHEEIDKIYISVLPEYKDLLMNLLDKYKITKAAGIVDGGDTGQDSIYNALKTASKENPPNSIVLIHDGVRPIVANEVISNNIKSVKEYGNAITSRPCHETILISKNGINPVFVPFRKETFSAQAPQSFYLNEIINAHEIIRKREERYEDLVDSCTIFEKLGLKTYMVTGNVGNIKVTYHEDVFLIEALMKCQKTFIQK